MDDQRPLKILDEKVARSKAEHYCAYQERSQQEVRNKLYEWGVWPSVIERIISELIEDSFLNEERFAKAYAKGKFNQKGWGKIKIKHGLKLKNVPLVIIKKALNEIADEDYELTLKMLLDKKNATLKEKNTFKRRYKLQQFAMSRGFESDLIIKVLKAD